MSPSRFCGQIGRMVKMRKKKIGITIAVLLVLGASLMFYLQMTRAYMPAEDEIALQIQFDIKEDIGLLVYDYCADGHAYSGGMSNADKSLIQHDSHMIIGWKKQELNSSSDAVELSIQFRIITEYVDPNYENIYPDDITRYMDPISWEAHFGESYCITITGDKTNGYTAALTSTAGKKAQGRAAKAALSPDFLSPALFGKQRAPSAPSLNRVPPPTRTDPAGV